MNDNKTLFTVDTAINPTIARYIGKANDMYFSGVDPVLSAKNASIELHDAKKFQVLGNVTDDLNWAKSKPTLNEFWILIKYVRYPEKELENVRDYLDRQNLTSSYLDIIQWMMASIQSESDANVKYFKSLLLDELETFEVVYINQNKKKDDVSSA